MNTQKLGVPFWIGIIGVIITGLAVWFIATSAGRETKEVRESTSREVALMCTTDMATQFHIHPELSIVINGKAIVLPPDIGIKPACMNSLHTHDSSGIIHVEAPVQKDFVLSDFFAVWEQPFDQTQILEYKVDANHEIVMTVNGEVSTDYENLLLVDKDKIVIEYKAK